MFNKNRNKTVRSADAYKATITVAPKREVTFLNKIAAFFLSPFLFRSNQFNF